MKIAVLRLAVGIIGNAATLSLFTVPILTFARVIRKKSTENFSCFPYIVSLLCCLVYTWYASPFVSHGWENLPVVTIDSAGILLESSFIVIYIWFAPRREKVKATAMTVLVLFFSALVVVVSLLAYHDRRHRKLLVGCIGIVSAALMYGSPLVAVKTVIKTKSVEFMPFYLSLFSFFSSFLWVVFGLLNKDFFIASPNMVGCVLAVLQLALYFTYSKRGAEEEHKSLDIEKNEGKIKTGLQNDHDNVVP
ncbi:hypothetical protein K2173_013048 [Erythroxylum novogranatense]|uniref:Bidirectional sugar transporter SWEET n=1 Tax=Erythroxylum novogranatense TaxID=1862640 RepID=A0AAV8S6X8_9ROSI|nr:hypothetical protein K2173_013048 [Erythroxylum novogranatense]